VIIISDQCDITQDTLIVAIGGDGTMLYASDIAVSTGATVMGINTGRVGFLTDFSFEDLQKNSYLGSILDVGKTSLFPREDRIMLFTTTPEGYEFSTMNEISIANSNSDSAIEYEVWVDNMSAGSHRANSVVISTPTGSTAYALSAGGAIIYPSLNVLEITPVAPMTMASRPIIVGGDAVIKVSARIRDGGTVSIRGDGQLFGSFDTHNSGEAATFTINTQPNKVRLLHTPAWNFFEVLTTKLGWS